MTGSFKPMNADWFSSRGEVGTYDPGRGKSKSRNLAKKGSTRSKGKGKPRPYVREEKRTVNPTNKGHII